MKFRAVRDFRNHPGRVWDDLDREGEIVVTSNGKPIGVLTRANEDDLEETLRAVRLARATRALTRLREAAVASGAARMTSTDVDREIAATRRARARR